MDTKNDLSVYADADPVWLHSLYGENCWQRAIGYETPMIIIRKYSPSRYPANTSPDDFREACYVKIMPGNAYKALKHIRKMSEQEISDAVQTGCREAQMVVLDSEDADLQNDWRKIAFYTTDERDVHFVSKDTGKGTWSDTTPFEGVRVYDRLPQRIGSYKLKAIFGARQGIKPLELRKLFRTITLAPGRKIHIMEDSKELNHGPPILLNYKVKWAYSSARRKEIPMPFWNEALQTCSPQVK